jgi:hypothetical protein
MIDHQTGAGAVLQALCAQPATVTSHSKAHRTSALLISALHLKEFTGAQRRHYSSRVTRPVNGRTSSTTSASSWLDKWAHSVLRQHTWARCYGQCVHRRRPDLLHVQTCNMSSHRQIVIIVVVQSQDHIGWPIGHVGILRTVTTQYPLRHSPT